MSLDSFEKVRDFVYRCKTCGEEVPAGIINISGHWAKCTGKDKMDFINKVANSSLYIDDKMDLIRKEFNIEQ